MEKIIGVNMPVSLIETYGKNLLWKIKSHQSIENIYLLTNNSDFTLIEYSVNDNKEMFGTISLFTLDNDVPSINTIKNESLTVRCYLTGMVCIINFRTNKCWKQT